MDAVDTKVDVRPSAVAHPFGYVVVLIGAVGFAVSCFLPFYGGPILGAGSPVSLYRLVVNSPIGGGEVGGVLYLFAGAAIVGVISLIGSLRARTWTPHALMAGVLVWALTWLGVLLNQAEFGRHEMGYWTAYASLGVAVMSAIVVWVSSRRREREPLPTRSA